MFSSTPMQSIKSISLPLSHENMLTGLRIFVIVVRVVDCDLPRVLEVGGGGECVSYYVRCFEFPLALWAGRGKVYGFVYLAVKMEKYVGEIYLRENKKEERRLGSC